MSDVDDWELVARAQQGDRSAFAALVRRYQQPLAHFCQRMLGSAEDAEDVAQEAFVRLHRHLPRLRPRAKFSTVLFGYARNLALNHLRDSGRRGRGRTVALENLGRAETAPGVQADSGARRSEAQAQLAAGLAALPPRYREVLLLRELEQMDYEAIARVVGCRIGTVRSRLARAREQLRRILEERGVEAP